VSYFEDLTPHTYTRTDGEKVLNIGWLDLAHPFATGPTSEEFQEALHQLRAHPIHLHRGFHDCQFCPDERHLDYRKRNPERHGNGQIRVQGIDGTWYAAPTMIHHYVTAHQYCPPTVFIDAVLRVKHNGAREGGA
jgi:hypothetical protein